MKLNLTVEKKYEIDLNTSAIIREAINNSADELFDSIVYSLNEAIETSTDEGISLDSLDSLIKYQMFQVLLKELMDQLPRAFENYDFDRGEMGVTW